MAMRQKIIGTVSSVDSVRHMARVHLAELNVVTGWLYILRQGTAWMPSLGDSVLCEFLDAEEGDGFIMGVVQ